MKVLVYDRNALKSVLATYGYGKLTLISKCSVVEELNGRYEAEVVVSLTDSKATYIKKWCILRIEGQLFRVYNTVVNDRNNTITAHARHIFYDLDFGFIEDSRAENKTMEEALLICKPTDLLPFTPHSDITKKNTIYYVKNNGVNAIFRTIERWGVGELVRDNFDYYVNYSKGSDKGVTFTYKKIEGIEVTNDSDSVVTRLYPTGKDGITLAEKYIDIPQWNDDDYPPYHITKEVKFDSAENEGELRILAKATAENIGLGTTNFKINVSDLLNTDLYKEMRSLIDVEVGDIVTVKHDKLDIRMKIKVIKKEIDHATGKCTLELGQSLDNFFKSVDNSNVSVDMPSLEEFRDGLFYFGNGVEIDLIRESTRLCSLGYALQTRANLLVFINVFLECLEDSKLIFTLHHDNEVLPLKPKLDINKGDRVVSFSYPLLAVQGEIRHQLDVFLEVDGGSIRIPKEQLHVMIKGQGISGGGAERPHAEVIETFNQDVIDFAQISKTQNVSISIQKPKVLAYSDTLRGSSRSFTDIIRDDIIAVSTEIYIPEED